MNSTYSEERFFREMTCGGHFSKSDRQLLKRSVGEVVTDFCVY